MRGLANNLGRGMNAVLGTTGYSWADSYGGKYNYIAHTSETTPDAEGNVKYLVQSTIPMDFASGLTQFPSTSDFITHIRADFDFQVASVATLCSSPLTIDPSTPNASIPYPSSSRSNLEAGMTNSQVFAIQPKNGTFKFIFSSPPESQAANLSLLALIVASGSYMHLDGHQSTGVFASPCVTKASWVIAHYNVTATDKSNEGATNMDWQLRDHDLLPQTDQLDDYWFTDRNPFQWHEPAITIEPEWVTKLQLDVDRDRKDSLSATDAISAYLSSHSESAYENDDGTPALGLMYSNLIAHAMSTLGSSQYPDDGIGFRLDSPTSTYSNPHSLKIRYYIDGKGYTLRTWPVILAATIMCLYCLVTLVFIAFSLSTAVSSNAWDSASEITALALYSKVPDTSGHMSAGLSTLSFYRC
jgi:hypothetical protein